MSLLAEILLELLGQIVWQIVGELLFGLGDLATGGRMKRVLAFAFAGAPARGC